MTNGERFLHPLQMKHHLQSGNQKKKNTSRVFFFLTGLRPVLPLGQCSPRKSVALHPKCLHKRKIPSHLVPANQNIQRYQHTTTTKNNVYTTTTKNRLDHDRRGMASLQSNSTFSFKHHLTGEAWPACRAILPFHSNTT